MLVLERSALSFSAKDSIILARAKVQVYISWSIAEPRDPDEMDDVDTEAADHVYDDCRYRILASANRYAKSIDVHNPR